MLIHDRLLDTVRLQKLQCHAFSIMSTSLLGDDSVVGPVSEVSPLATDRSNAALSCYMLHVTTYASNVPTPQLYMVVDAYTEDTFPRCFLGWDFDRVLSTVERGN